MGQETHAALKMNFVYRPSRIFSSVPDGCVASRMNGPASLGCFSCARAHTGSIHSRRGGSVRLERDASFHSGGRPPLPALEISHAGSFPGSQPPVHLYFPNSVSNYFLPGKSSCFHVRHELALKAHSFLVWYIR